MADVLVWQPGLVLPAEFVGAAEARAIQDALLPEQVVGLTAWAEARSRLEPGRGWVENPVAAMLDIVSVIDNRAHDQRWRALGAKGVCLAPRQFSCWAPLQGRENYEALLDRAQRLAAGEQPSPKLRACIEAAGHVLAGALLDRIGAATHYYAPASMVPAGHVPGWVTGARLTCDRFGHRFYASVR